MWHVGPLICSLEEVDSDRNISVIKSWWCHFLFLFLKAVNFPQAWWRRASQPYTGLKTALFICSCFMFLNVLMVLWCQVTECHFNKYYYYYSQTYFIFQNFCLTVWETLLFRTNWTLQLHLVVGACVCLLYSCLFPSLRLFDSTGFKLIINFIYFLKFRTCWCRCVWLFSSWISYVDQFLE